MDELLDDYYPGDLEALRGALRGAATPVGAAADAMRGRAQGRAPRAGDEPDDVDAALASWYAGDLDCLLQTLGR